MTSLLRGLSDDDLSDATALLDQVAKIISSSACLPLREKSVNDVIVENIANCVHTNLNSQSNVVQDDKFATAKAAIGADRTMFSSAKSSSGLSRIVFAQVNQTEAPETTHVPHACSRDASNLQCLQRECTDAFVHSDETSRID